MDNLIQLVELPPDDQMREMCYRSDGAGRRLVLVDHDTLCQIETTLYRDRRVETAI